MSNLRHANGPPVGPNGAGRRVKYNALCCQELAARFDCMQMDVQKRLSLTGTLDGPTMNGQGFDYGNCIIRTPASERPESDFRVDA